MKSNGERFQVKRRHALVSRLERTFNVVTEGVYSVEPFTGTQRVLLHGTYKALGNSSFVCLWLFEVRIEAGVCVCGVFPGVLKWPCGQHDGDCRSINKELNVKPNRR